MQVVGGKALLSAGRGSHLLPSSCSSLFVVLSSPIRSRSWREGGQRTLQLLGTCLRPLCPGQEGWMVAQPKGFRDKEPHWWLCRHSPGWGSRRLTLGPQPCRSVNGTPGLDRSRCIQAGHHRWAGLSPCPNLSLVLLLFCSLCLTNSLGFSWFLFQSLPSFCRFSTFPVPPFAAPCCQEPQCLPASSQIPLPFRWLQRYFALLAACLIQV